MNGNYDSLGIGKSNEWYLGIVGIEDTGNSLISNQQDDPYIKHEFPTGSKLKLSGLAKAHEAYGLLTAFSPDMLYLHGTVNNRVVWIPAFQFWTLKDSKNSINDFNMRNSGLDKYWTGVACNWRDL